MKPTQTVIADRLSVTKNKQVILNDISFSIKSGSVTGLIGPSGAGKTTLIRSLAGVQRSTDGQLTVLDRPAGSRGLRGKIGYEAQTPAVYADLTVEQNLRYFGSLLGADSTTATEAIERVRLEPQRKQLVATLSGGQKARVSLALALLGSPDLLLLDEPTVGLDPLLRNQLWDLFDELAADGKTLLVSSHVMDEAERCRDLILLRDGQLLWHGERRQLLDKTGASSVETAFLALVEEK